jgi:hypothetical protein
MTDQPTIQAENRPNWKSRKVRGKGTGKPPPAVVFSSAEFAQYLPSPEPKRGAPVNYSEELMVRLCAWVSSGRTLTEFGELEDTPSVSTIYRWFDADPALWERYARARIGQTYSLTDKMLIVCNELLVKANKGETTPEMVAAIREWVSAVKFLVSKIAPKIWGDKLDVRQEISGPGGQPIQMQTQVLLSLIENPVVAERLSEVHLAAIREAALLLAAPAGVGSGAPGDGAGPTIDGEASEIPSGE